MYKPPYVGVTGFTKSAEVQAVLDALPANLPRKLMVGVLANRETLRGKKALRFPKRYPKKGKIADIFPSDHRVLNLIHYSSSSEGLTLAHEMVEMRVEHGSSLCHGVQVNIAWPDPNYLHVYRGMVEHLESSAISPQPTNEVIVLQVGRDALEQCGYNPFAVAARLREYEGNVNYVLLDQSGGRGEPFTRDMAALTMTVADQMPKSMGLVLAGGLSALSVDTVLNYFQSFEQPTLDRATLSLDAEGRLRSLNDDLITQAAIGYVKRSLAALHAPVEADEG